MRAPSALFLCLLTIGVKGAVPPASFRGGLVATPGRLALRDTEDSKCQLRQSSASALKTPARNGSRPRRGQASQKYIAKHDHRLLDTCQTLGALPVSVHIGDCLQSAGFLLACVGQNSHVFPFRVVRPSFRVLALKWPFMGVSEGVPWHGRLQ